MAKGGLFKEALENSSSGNWNAAPEYSENNIVSWFLKLDDCVTLARMGTLEITDEFLITDNIRNKMRMLGLKRMCHCLMMIANNTRFAVRKGDKDIVENHYNFLKQIYPLIDTVLISKVNQRDKITTFLIDETKFDKIFYVLDDIKMKIKEPLNRANLIFIYSEEFDPHSYKQTMKNRFVTQG